MHFLLFYHQVNQSGLNYFMPGEETNNFFLPITLVLTLCCEPLRVLENNSPPGYKRLKGKFFLYYDFSCGQDKSGYFILFFQYDFFNSFDTSQLL
jgi:hypothetical protein